MHTGCGAMGWQANTCFLILGGRAARSFAVGVLVVALPLSVKAHGLSASAANAVLSAGLAGATVQTLAVGHMAGGRRFVLLTGLTLSMAVASAAMACASQFWLLLAVALVGGLCLQPNIAAQVPLEQASLAAAASNTDDRTRLFGWYNALSSGAISLGTLATSIPVPAVLLGRNSENWLLAGEAAPLQLAGVAVILFLAAASYVAGTCRTTPAQKDEALIDAPKQDLPLSRCPHRQRILLLAGLFAVDSWGGGICMNAALTYWLSVKYSREAEIGILYFACNLLGVGSYAVAVWLSKRIGLLNTMVFTHLPANFTLLITPFMPSRGLVYALFLLRASLSQMDVPARDTYMTTVVGPEERVACTSMINTGRSLACVLGPATGAWLWWYGGPAAPLVVSGAVKACYDLALFFVFRSVDAADDA